jgi:N6-adenosine-specific RNA methylase IME4
LIEIRNAPSFEKVEAARRTAKGFADIFKPVKHVADRAGEVWTDAEIKIADEYARLDRAKGTRGQLIGRSKPVPPINDAATIKELGLNKKVLQRGGKLRAIGAVRRTAIKAKLKADGKAVTPNTILAAARCETKEQRRQEILTAVFSETGPFDVVVIDPPWPMQKIDRDERPNQDAFDYDVMTLDELAQFWPEKIAPKLNEDVHVFCWTTEKYLPATLLLLEKWDLRYVLTMVWLKPGGFQPYGLPQYNTEFIVYARKAAPMFIDTKDFSTGNVWPRREHSRKPKEFYELISRVTGGSRLDVFARERHAGFAQYGKEIGKFDDGDDSGKLARKYSIG